MGATRLRDWCVHIGFANQYDQYIERLKDVFSEVQLSSAKFTRWADVTLGEFCYSPPAGSITAAGVFCQAPSFDEEVHATFKGWMHDVVKKHYYSSVAGDSVSGEISENRLLGEFSYVEVSGKSAKIITDFYGTCPVYFSRGHDGRGWVAASDIRLVLAHPAVRRRVSRRACLHFLSDASAIGEDEFEGTFFEDIFKMRPREVLNLSEGSSCSARYMPSLDHVNEALRKTRTEAEWVTEFRGTFNQCVLDRVRGGGKGLLLSGGVDSSSVLAAWLDSGAQDIVRPICFNLTFNDAGEQCVDSVIAKELCDAADVELELVQGGDCLRYISTDDWPAYIDGPDGSANPLGVRRCLSHARGKDVGALLTGEGGDALLGGGCHHLLHDAVLRHEGLLAMVEYSRCVLGHSIWSPAFLMDFVKAKFPRLHIADLFRKMSLQEVRHPMFILLKGEASRQLVTEFPLAQLSEFNIPRKYAAHLDLAAMLYPRAAYFDAMSSCGSHFHPFIDPRLVAFYMHCPPQLHHAWRKIRANNAYATSKMLARRAYETAFGGKGLRKETKTSYNFMCRKMMHNSASAALKLADGGMRLHELGMIDGDRFASELLAYSIIARDPNASFGCRYHYVRAAIDLETWLRRFDDEGALAEKWLKIRLE